MADAIDDGEQDHGGAGGLLDVRSGGAVVLRFFHKPPAASMYRIGAIGPATWSGSRGLFDESVCPWPT